MRECSIMHGNKCASISGPTSKQINILCLIEVRDKVIVRFPDVNICGIKYITLSYVWGKAQRLVLT